MAFPLHPDQIAVVTGLGMVTPLGPDTSTAWPRLLAGEGIRHPISLFDTAGCRCREGAEAVLPAETYPSSARQRRWSRASHLAVPAAREALRQAGLLSEEGKCLDPFLPLSLSTTGGGMERGESFFRRAREGKRLQQLTRVARYQPQQQALDLQQAIGTDGPSMIVANACASGANAIGHAADLIRAGRHDLVLAGGFEALTDLIFTGFDCLQALSTTSCRPFDETRDGLMLGEGAAFLIVESLARAQRRGAPVLAVIAGYGCSTDLHHLTQPAPEGTALLGAMEEAARQAGIASSGIGYVNAHGTATPMNDGAEARSYEQFFETALPGVKISSTKAAIGHTLGAAGAIEAAFVVLALQDGAVPPQIGTTVPLASMAASLPKIGERVPGLEHVMSVNLGFGGSNAALLFSKLSQGGNA